MSPPFVLASGSPRRGGLLKEAGYRFTVRAADVEEISNRSLTLCEIALCNATRKGLRVARAHPDAVVLAADTLVALHGEVMGKPADLKEAMSILRQLSGRTHEVCSAVFICDLERARSCAFHEISRVRFRSLSGHEIRDYIASVDPLDKAGAYAAQSRGSAIIARIDGSFTNVVGLPMEKTTAALRRFGIEPKQS
ncbi:MAG: Maf family protein [Verrucomicrobiota bacterium]|nr:Maf family protein [Verrucomicrobiota bacterium]